jgi:chromate transporter
VHPLDITGKMRTIESMPRDSTKHSTIFLSFLKLGCVAFGGPVAHLGYFREEFVRRRRWISESEYADLVALCQFLPGPASSQVGFAIGHRRGGVPGALLAWLGFTLPSALLMIGFALGLSVLGDLSGAGWIAGLKLAAVAVVANAIWGMAAKLCPDRPRAIIALMSAAVLLLVASALWQIAVIAGGALVGWWLFRGTAAEANTTAEARGGSPERRGWPYLMVFAGLLIGLPVFSELTGGGWSAMVEGFYRAGSLVFGGGHVVLPLLDSFTVGRGWIDQSQFLAGYGAAQALPGPLFAFSSFLGTSLSVGPGGVTGGVLALLAIYLPSCLLVLGALPYWERLRGLTPARAALMGTNAAVVGLLLAAFYDPIWTAAVTGPIHLAFALAAFALLRFGSLPPWLLVLVSAGLGQLCL